MKHLMTAVTLVAGLAASSVGNTSEVLDSPEKTEKLAAATDSPSANTTTKLADILKPLKANYPKGCDEQYLGRSGLCLLTNKRPLGNL